MNSPPDHERSPRYLPSLYLPSGRANPDSLKYYQRAHGFTSREFADWFNIHIRTLNAWHAGRANPNPVNMAIWHKIAQYTRAMMEQHDGYMPAHKTLKYLSQADGEERHELLAEIAALTDKLVRQLSEENSSLRMRVTTLEADLGEARRELAALRKMTRKLRHMLDLKQTMDGIEAELEEVA